MFIFKGVVTVYLFTHINAFKYSYLTLLVLFIKYSYVIKFTHSCIVSNN